MVIARLESALERVQRDFDRSAAGLVPLAQSLLKRPSLFLSKILMATILTGDREPGQVAVSSCLALEFLEQALALAAAHNESVEFNEDCLLVTDYFYAQAIDQVIGLGKPEIIGVLAGAIMAAAQDRAIGDYADFRKRLVGAALEIGFFLGEISGVWVSSLREATTSRFDGREPWIGLFPAGSIRDYLQEALTPVTQS